MVKIKKVPVLSLRFYATDIDVVIKYMVEFLVLVPTAKGYTISALTQSMNKVIPKNSHQVLVRFVDAASRDAMGDNKEMRDWYFARATPKHLQNDVKLSVRKPGDSVYKNPIKI